MDETARRWSRVDYEDVRSVYNKLKKADTISSQYGLMLIRCHGSLLKKIHPKMRSDAMKETWQLLKDLDMDFTVEHYNAWLSVSLENQDEFSITEFLEEIEFKNITPNRVTYQLLIQKYCEEGDLAGASKILEHIKSLNISITSVVFHSLIKGHMKQGNIDGAKSILESMRKSGLEPSSATYSALLCGHASLGKMDGIEQTIKDAEEDNIFLRTQDYLHCLFALCEGGFTTEAEKFLKDIPFHGRYNLDLIHCVDELITRDHLDIALKLYNNFQENNNNIPASNNEQGERSDPSMHILRTLIVNKKPADVVMKTMEYFRERNPDAANIDQVARLSLHYDLSDNVITYFEAMKKEGMPIRLHFYWPLFVEYGKTGNMEGIFKAVASMWSLSEDRNDTLLTLAYNVGNQLSEMDVQERISRLEEAGIPKDMLDKLELFEEMKRGVVGRALQLVESGVSIPGVLVSQMLPTALRNSSEDYATIIQILKNMDTKLDLTDSADVLLLSLSASKDINGTASEDVINMLIKQDFRHKLSAEKKDTVRTRFVQKGVSENLIEEILQFQSANKSSFKEGPYKPIRELGSKEMQQLFDQRVSRNQGVERLGPLLMSKYLEEENSVGMLKIKEALDAVGHVYSIRTLEELGVNAVVNDKDVDKAMEYKHQIDSQNDGLKQPFYMNLILGIAESLVAQGRIDEAISLLNNYGSKGLQDIEKEKLKYTNICADIISISSQQESFSKTKELLEVIFSHGFAINQWYDILHKMTGAYIDRGIDDETLEVLEYCATKYGKVPNYMRVFRHFIEKEDPERLQKVVDLVTAQLGENKVLEMLVVSFVECDKIKQADRILQTEGFTPSMEFFNNTASKYIRNNKLVQLERIVTLSKQVFGVDRDQMLFHLVRMHCTQKDWAKALDVFTTYEEEGILPSPRTKRYLGKALLGNDQTVPFEIPEVVTVDRNLSKKAIETADAVNRGSRNATAEFLKTNEFENMNTSDRAEYGRLLKSKSVIAFKRFLFDLGTQGDVDTLQEVKKLEGNQKHVNVFHTQCLFTAYINSNRAKEFVDIISTNTDVYMKECTSSRNIHLLGQKHPDLLESVAKLIDEYVEKTANWIPLHHLLAHYILTEKTAETEVLLQKHPDLAKSLQPKNVINLMREQGKEEDISKLIDFVQKHSENKGPLQYIYSSMIHKKASTEDADGCLSYYNKALSHEIELTNLHAPAMMRMEQLLQSQNKDVPWPLGTFQRRPRTASSEDSSSSSDSSDDEKDIKNSRSN